MTKELVINAILAMLARHESVDGYTSIATVAASIHQKTVMGLLQQYGLQQNFSHVGMSGDNAWSESFFATMKKELLHWRTTRRKYRSRRQCARIYIAFTIEENPEGVGYMSPRENLKPLRKERLAKAALQIVYKKADAPITERLPLFPFHIPITFLSFNSGYGQGYNDLVMAVGVRPDVHVGSVLTV